MRGGKLDLYEGELSMKIRILGTGCPNCKKLYALTMQALAELDIAADLQKVEDLKEIMSYKVLGTPGLVINDNVKLYGKVPSLQEIKRLIQEEQEN
jgi:small redox-active disulfide protein 2